MRRTLFLTLLLPTLILGISPIAEEAAQSEEEDLGLRGAHLRIARPTDDLAPVVAFYRDALGFEVLASFEDHEGFDGVMLGHSGAGYHLELTHQQGHKVGKAPNEEHLLVFYLPELEAWQAALDRLKQHGHEPVPSNNPYWDGPGRGKTFEDPDGYRVVLVNGGWGR